ncbi:MAG: hypothetical protein WC362_08520 [Methanoregula sp.]
MNLISIIADRWLGLCPKAPTLRTAPAVLLVLPETVRADRPDGSGPADRPGRVRQGVSIAAGSLRTMVRDRHMLWFSLLSGLLMIFLFALIYGTRGNIYYDPFLIRILLGDFILWFDPRLIPILAFCLFCFTFLMAGLILYRNANSTDHPHTIWEGFAGARAHAGSLAALSIALALAGTILIAVVTSDNLTGISFQVMGAFLPYPWFLSGGPGLTITFWLFGSILFVTIILILALLYVVPVIVLENKGLVPALAGSVTLIRKTWHEMLGGLLVYGALVLLVGIISLVLCQSLSLYNYDPGFWNSQGLMPIMTLCSEIILFCFTILMAVCSTAAGVAIADLYRVGKSDGISGISGENLDRPEPAS